MVVGNPVIDLFSVVTKIDGTSIGGVSDDGIPFPAGSSKVRDVSTQDSGVFTEKRLGRFDAGNTTMKGNYIPSDAGQIALSDAANDRLVHTFTIDATETSGDIITFSGLVTKFQPGNSGNTETFTATIEVTGEPSIATTYAAVTALTFSAAGTWYPVFGADVNTYVNTQLTAATSATLAVTAAASTAIYIYSSAKPDGELKASAAPSTAIPMATAVNVYPVKVKIEETGKATRFINITLVRL